MCRCLVGVVVVSCVSCLLACLWGILMAGMTLAEARVGPRRVVRRSTRRTTRSSGVPTRPVDFLGASREVLRQVPAGSSAAFSGMDRSSVVIFRFRLQHTCSSLRRCWPAGPSPTTKTLRLPRSSTSTVSGRRIVCCSRDCESWKTVSPLRKRSCQPSVKEPFGNRPLLSSKLLLFLHPLIHPIVMSSCVVGSATQTPPYVLSKRFARQSLKSSARA